MKPSPRVLIVEDEAPIAELIAVNLRHNGFTPVWAEDAEAAQRELDAVQPDVVLLDWMLPGASGLQLARRWRADARTKSIPILMLTARGGEPDKVAGLDAGADDYITKPFSTQELLARIRAVLRRRAPEQASEALEAGGLRLDAAAHRVLVEAADVAGGVGRATELRDAAKGAAASSVAGVKDALPTMPEQPVMTLQTGRGASQLQRLLVPGGRAR